MLGRCFLAGRRRHFRARDTLSRGSLRADAPTAGPPPGAAGVPHFARATHNGVPAEVRSQTASKKPQSRSTRTKAHVSVRLVSYGTAHSWETIWAIASTERVPSARFHMRAATGLSRKPVGADRPLSPSVASQVPVGSAVAANLRLRLGRLPADWLAVFVRRPLAKKTDPPTAALQNTKAPRRKPRLLIRQCIKSETPTSLPATCKAIHPVWRDADSRRCLSSRPSTAPPLLLGQPDVETFNPREYSPE